MKLLKEFLSILKEQEVNKETAAAVYHRDYLKTRNKKYRKYDPRKYRKKMQESFEYDDAEDVSDYRSLTLQQLEQELSDALKDLREMKMAGEPKEEIEELKDEIRKIRYTLELKREQIAASAR